MSDNLQLTQNHLVFTFSIKQLFTKEIIWKHKTKEKSNLAKRILTGLFRAYKFIPSRPNHPAIFETCWIPIVDYGAAFKPTQLLLGKGRYLNRSPLKRANHCASEPPYRPFHYCISDQQITPQCFSCNPGTQQQVINDVETLPFDIHPTIIYQSWNNIVCLLQVMDSGEQGLFGDLQTTVSTIAMTTTSASVAPPNENRHGHHQVREGFVSFCGSIQWNFLQK